MEISRLMQMLNKQYHEGKNDYYMPPLVKDGIRGNKDRIKDKDCIFFCIRRGDRQAQILNAFCDSSFSKFPTKQFKKLFIVPLVEHQEKSARVESLFATVRPKNTFGHIISNNGLRQLRVGESEKASHITYFFNGRRNEPFKGEDRIITPSPAPGDFIKYPGNKYKKVAELTANALKTGKYSFVFVNLAAGDIIGHIDNWDANVKCANAVDNALAIIRDTGLRNNYVVAVTADHGLLECAFNKDGTLNLGHTMSPVPFGIVGAKLEHVNIHRSCNSSKALCPTLADVAPTLLNIMGLNASKEMTGIPLAILKSDNNPKKCVLVLLDGWGIGSEDPLINPIAAANVPVFTSIKNGVFYTELAASGQSVGLPAGRSGNSETGHLTIGAGRIIPQDELRIAEAIKKDYLTNHDVLVRTCKKTMERNGAAHIVMMLSDKSSHGNINEGIAVTKAVSQNGLKEIYIHLIMDGRSAPPKGGGKLLHSLVERIGSDVSAEIITAIGRGYALDRSGKYTEHTAIAYRGMVHGKGYKF